ncbi:diacylglycerol/lipid kinase family protein [Halorussus halobius]|uniref:diacylglycerol/lipid kinase family protein n=1 Tax=Halorussus halobius TaxID=1710537 RepID=UPI001092059C|nr:YegS/Rv2252/BmrU family lipid kinase [Halorussus halobius]
MGFEGAGARTDGGTGTPATGGGATDSRPPEIDRALVLNPASGDGSHREQVRELADRDGFVVLETQAEAEAARFARLVAEAGADLVAAAGGDGTLNRVVRGLDAADALDEVTVGVVPCGTGNNFASNVGVESIDHAFEVLADGERRRIDVATADGRLFLNSCIAGVTADASASTTPGLKDRLGVLAYVVTGLRAAADFDALPLAVEATGSAASESWSGEALMVLVGNARRFPSEGRSQANCEDGLLDVTVVERMPTADLLEEAAIHRLFGDGTDHVTHLRPSELRVEVRRDEPVEFSFDGEMGSYESLTMRTSQRVLELCVGENYVPDPD